MTTLFSAVVRRNMSALFVLQGGNYLIPLLLVPYLIRTLGFDVFGTWMFALSFVIVARVCVSYGFDLTATRQVAVIGLDNKQKLSELVVDVIMVRLIVWIVAALVLVGLAATVETLQPIQALIVLGLMILLGEILFPVWLFQGLERMRPIVYLRLGAKVVNLMLVIILVNHPEDLLLVPILEALTTGAAGAFALALAWRRFGLGWVQPSFERLKDQFQDGGPVFASTLAVQFYTTVNMIVLGFLVGSASVAAYAVAEKVYSAIRGLLGPFVQAIFPTMSRMHASSNRHFQQNYAFVLRRLLVALVAVGVVLFPLSRAIVVLLAGEAESQSIATLQVFALSFPFALGSFLAPMLVARSRSKALMRITILGGVLGLFLCPPLAYFFGAPGAAAAFLVVQGYNSAALFTANRRV